MKKYIVVLCAVLMALLFGATVTAHAGTITAHNKVCAYQANGLSNPTDHQVCWTYTADNYNSMLGAVADAKSWIHADPGWYVVANLYENVNRNATPGMVIVLYRVHRCDEPGYSQSQLDYAPYYNYHDNSGIPYYAFNDETSSIQWFAESDCETYLYQGVKGNAPELDGPDIFAQPIIWNQMPDGWNDQLSSLAWTYPN